MQAYIRVRTAPRNIGPIVEFLVSVVVLEASSEGTFRVQTQTGVKLLVDHVEWIKESIAA